MGLQSTAGTLVESVVPLKKSAEPPKKPADTSTSSDGMVLSKGPAIPKSLVDPVLSTETLDRTRDRTITTRPGQRYREEGRAETYHAKSPRTCTNQRVVHVNHHNRELRQDATSNPTTYTTQTHWGTLDTTTPISTRTKAKSRPQSEEKPPTSPSTRAPDEEACPSEPEFIAVSSASKDTLSRLFTSDPKNRKLLHFDTIVAALEDAGLTAKRGGRCSGSAVTFKHRGGKGSITFHSPHPEPKIEFHKQRTWGTRLQNKFGWELAMFVERVG